MPTKVNVMLSEDSGAANKEHEFRWTDQSGQTHGPGMLRTSYGTFVVSFTETGSGTIASPIVTGIADTIRIRVGMQCTATNFTGTQTVVSVDSATQVTLSTNATATGATTLTFASQNSADPIATFGYNRSVNGEITPRQGYAALQIEGHYHRDSDDSAFMETFFAFGIDGLAGQSRPFFCWFDKITKKPLSVSVAPGVGQDFLVTHEDVNGGAGGLNTLRCNQNFLDLRPSTATAQDNWIRMGSQTGFGSSIVMTANGVDFATTPQCRLRFLPSGTTSIFSLDLYDNAATPDQKAGKFFLSAQPGVDSVSMTLGGAGAVSHSIMYGTMANATVNTLYGFRFDCKANQTAAMVSIGGKNVATEAAELHKVQIYPQGHIAVRESGNTTTDRVPGTGANTVTINTANSPAAAAGTTKWFPILDTAGALHWVPGVSAA